MNEDQLTRLRNRLNRRRQRLEATSVFYFRQTLRRFLHFLETEPFFTPLLEELKANEKGGGVLALRCRSYDPGVLATGIWRYSLRWLELEVRGHENAAHYLGFLHSDWASRKRSLAGGAAHAIRGGLGLGFSR
jgi:hypothetical protein